MLFSFALAAVFAIAVAAPVNAAIGVGGALADAASVASDAIDATIGLYCRY